MSSHLVRRKRSLIRVVTQQPVDPWGKKKKKEHMMLTFSYKQEQNKSQIKISAAVRGGR